MAFTCTGRAEPVAFFYATEKCKSASFPILATIFAHSPSGNLPRISHVFHPSPTHSVVAPHYFFSL